MFSGCDEPSSLNINSVEKKLPKTNNSVPNFNYQDVFNVNLGSSSPPKVVKEEQESPADLNNLTDQSPK